jgi:hypothetical protein
MSSAAAAATATNPSDFRLPYTTSGYAGQNGRINLAAPGAGINTVPDSAGFAHRVAPDAAASKDLMRGNWEETPVSMAFFSPENMTLLQNATRREIYEKSGPKQWVIEAQDIDELKIIMRSIYLQYGQNRPDGINQQVQDLNRTVLDWIVPRVLSEVQYYFYYLNDISHMPVPIERPMLLSQAGTKTFALQKFI